MKIAKPNYLMAPNFLCSSFFTFKGFMPIFMLWLPTDICSGILPHLSHSGICISLEVQPQVWQYSQGCTRFTKIWSGLQCQMEIWGFWRHILIPQKFPALCSAAVNPFQGGFSMKIYHWRHWNIIQISHIVFGACLGFPVSSEISNYKAISWGRCRIWQIILLTESRNDPHHI